METAQTQQATMAGKRLAEKLDKAGWGIALIWIGVAILLNFDWGAGLSGLGVIILTGQLLRQYLALGWDGFALALGICLGLAGLGPLLGERLDDAALLPILSIALGTAFLASALLRKRPG